MNFKEKLLNFGAKAKAYVVGASATGVAAVTSALTVTNGKIAFEEADKAPINEAISNGISNLWSSFTFVAPWALTFMGIGLVIGFVFRRK